MRPLELRSGMSDDRLSENNIAKNRRRTKIIVWSILGFTVLGGLFVLWQMLSNGRTWQVLLIVAVATFFAWRSYKQATNATRN